VISIIDDDESVREAAKNLVRSLGYTAAAFSSAEDYLQSPHLLNSACLITDLQMPNAIAAAGIARARKDISSAPPSSAVAITELPRPPVQAVE
jgi:FixJ family two-component response regulator